MKLFLTCVFTFLLGAYFAQFPGAAGSPGSTAMFKDSSAFVSWASTCVVTRGYQDIAFPNLGYANVGADSNGTKKPGVNPVVSLGDGGFAVLTFAQPIANGTGFDFAVFENSFNDVFLELAFVEVSSDGSNYFRFPATSNTPTFTQIGPFDNMGDATRLNNLAGKYRANYGTPFDLQDLIGTVGLNVNAITHVKVVDVVGSVSAPYASYDQNGNPINDPYPTAFGSGGFDLDGVGVINQAAVGIDEGSVFIGSPVIWPNPTAGLLSICSNAHPLLCVSIHDVNGNMLLNTADNQVDLSGLQNCVYLLKMTTLSGRCITRKVIKN